MFELCYLLLFYFRSNLQLEKQGTVPKAKYQGNFLYFYFKDCLELKLIFDRPSFFE